MRLKPIETKKAYMEIINQIRAQIEGGVLKAGDKMPSERELVEQLNVSRPTVREALSALEIIGLVESKPGEGRFVKSVASSTLNEETIKLFLEDSEPFELLEARITIETGTATIAAEKVDEDSLQELKKTLSKMEQLMLAGSVDEELDADSEFHFLIAEMTGNKFLINTMEQIAESMSNQLWKTLKKRAMSNKDVKLKYMEDHHNIYTAIKNGEAEKAGQFMRQHLLTVWEDLLD